jgi:hypothetical protein
MMLKQSSLFHVFLPTTKFIPQFALLSESFGELPTFCIIFALTLYVTLEKVGFQSNTSQNITI